MSALLGASPGVSVSVNIVLDVIKKSFPHLMTSPHMAEIVPTYGTDYRKPENAERFNELALEARKCLRLV